MNGSLQHSELVSSAHHFSLSWSGLLTTHEQLIPVSCCTLHALFTTAPTDCSTLRQLDTNPLPSIFYTKPACCRGVITDPAQRPRPATPPGDPARRPRPATPPGDPARRPRPATPTRHVIQGRRRGATEC